MDIFLDLEKNSKPKSTKKVKNKSKKSIIKSKTKIKKNKQAKTTKESINKNNIPATGLLVNEDYDNISHKTSLYFLKYNKFNSEKEEINKKMKKIYEKLNECITYWN